MRKKNKNNGLWKIGKVAEEAGVRTSLVRYYSNLGLLRPAEVLPSGYRFYEPRETLEKIRLIRSLQKEKPTLEKIKHQLNNDKVDGP
mgnify:CR=1 FL=1